MLVHDGSAAASAMSSSDSPGGRASCCRLVNRWAHCSVSRGSSTYSPLMNVSRFRSCPRCGSEWGTSRVASLWGACVTPRIPERWAVEVECLYVEVAVDLTGFVRKLAQDDVGKADDLVQDVFRDAVLPLDLLTGCRRPALGVADLAERQVAAGHVRRGQRAVGPAVGGPERLRWRACAVLTASSTTKRRWLRAAVTRRP